MSHDPTRPPETQVSTNKKKTTVEDRLLQPGGEWSMFKWVYIPLILFCCGAFTGYFLTMRQVLTGSNWFSLCLVRVLWQWGTAIWFGISLTTLTDSRRWKLTWVVSLTLFGFGLCYNAVFDLASGPEKIAAVITSVEPVERYSPGTKYAPGHFIMTGRSCSSRRMEPLR